MTTQTENHEIAKTILQQLGGNKFIVMTGAKDFTVQSSGLLFKLPSNFAVNKSNVVEIILDHGTDTYNVTFSRFGRDYKLTKISEHTDIYWDMLTTLFERETGLKTRLF